jgi:hypothetical protein
VSVEAINPVQDIGEKGTSEKEAGENANRPRKATVDRQMSSRWTRQRRPVVHIRTRG